MDRPKRPPPVPKFEEKKDKAALEEKLNCFMSMINQPQTDQTPPQIAIDQPKLEIPKV